MRIVDLTQTIHSNMHIFSAYPKPTFILWAKKEIHEFDSEIILMATHTGTHLDAPIHFIDKGKSIDQIEVDKFFLDAVILRVKSNPKSYIEADEIKRAEDKVKGIRKGEAVLIHTGWADEHLDKEDYLTHQPALSSKAAEYLGLKEPSLVGIDCANIDHNDDPKFPVHKILLKKDILIVENLCNLKNINKDRFKLIITPLKFLGGTGSPVRALALLE